MRKIDFYITAVIFVAVAFSCGPIVTGGQYVQFNITASGSGSDSQTITTDLDWDVITSYEIDPCDGKRYCDKTHVWNSTETYEFNLGTEGTATVWGIEMGIKADPIIDFGFAARAADGDTHFLFTSPLLNVDPAFINAEASASANFMCLNGSILSGDFPGDKIYQAQYNGTVFANLLDPGVMGMDNEPPTQLTGETITSMQTQFGFTLSGNGGQASGLSTFTITGDTIPEPATILLLGLGGLALIRKRGL